MKRMTIIVSIFFILILGGYNAALALPISVEYTYTEISTGNYQFDFTATNNIDPSWGQHIYRLDFYIPNANASGSSISGPTGWNWGFASQTWPLDDGSSINSTYFYCKHYRTR